MDNWDFAICKYSDNCNDPEEWFFPGEEYADGTVTGAMEAGMGAYENGFFSANLRSLHELKNEGENSRESEGSCNGTDTGWRGLADGIFINYTRTNFLEQEAL